MLEGADQLWTWLRVCVTHGCPDRDCLDIGCMWDVIEDRLDGTLYALCDVWGGRVLCGCEDVSL